MRLVVFSDLHDNWALLDHIKRERADMVVFLGDVSNKYDTELAKALLPVIDYYIPGNMDNKAIEEILMPKHFHGKIIRCQKRIVGIGYSNPTPFNTPGELSEEELLKLGKELVREGDILFTHAPPYGIMDMVGDGFHVGSKALREVVDKRPPLLHMFGHIHEEIGVQKRGPSFFVNLPPALEGKYAVVELEERPIIEFVEMPARD